MFGAEIVSYSNSHRSIYFRLSTAKFILLSISLLVVLTCSFISGIYFGADHSAQEYFSSYQSRIEQQDRTVKQLKVVAKKELSLISSMLGELQAELSKVKIANNSLRSDLKLEESALADWSKQIPQAGEELDFGLVGYIDNIANQIEQSQTELVAMHDLYLRQIKSNQYLPTLRPAATYVSSNFGWRKDPLGSGNTYYHEGIDFAGKTGTPIKAAASGIVTWSAPFDNYGNVIELDHGNGYVTRYAHNDKNLVSIGDRVEKGELIATMGSSGRATGPHLHFEIIKDGNHINPKRTLELN